MYESIGMSEIVEKLVPETATLMCARNESSDIEQFDRDRAGALLTGTVVRFTALL